MKKSAETNSELNSASKRFFVVMLLIVFASAMLFGCGDKGDDKETGEGQKQEQSAPDPGDNDSSKKSDKKESGKKESSKKGADKKDSKKKGSDKTDKDKKNAGKNSKNKSSKKEKSADKESSNNGGTAGESGGSQSGNGSSSSSSEGKKTKNNKSGKSKKKNRKKPKSGKSNKTKSKAGKKNKTAKKYCYLKIQCKKLKGKKGLDPGTKSLVPKSGYILKKKKMKIEKGETVYSLITKARDKYKFALNVEDTAFGKYIAGIAGIEEKACGDESGWKYNIDGKYPDRSCSAVKVKAGDRVEWVYVLKANQK